MRMHVFDDDAARQDAIQRNNPGSDIAGAESASGAIRLMALLASAVAPFLGSSR